jgi:hypothetical protein
MPFSDRRLLIGAITTRLRKVMEGVMRGDSSFSFELMMFVFDKEGFVL